MTKEEYLTQRCVICGGSNYKCDCAYVMRGRKCEKIEEVDDAWDAAEEATIEKAWEWVRKNFGFIVSTAWKDVFIKSMEESK